MALIQCPECGKQISETTPTCPHCGYRLNAPLKIKPTRLGTIEKNITLGVLYIFSGIIGAYIFFLFGIFFFIPLAGAMILLIIGINNIIGMRSSMCPYCGKLGKISKSSEGYKCSVCKKRSIKKGEYLYPVS